APDGTLYIAFLQFQGGFGSTLPHAGVWIAKSTDGGESFVQQKVADIRQIPSPIPPRGTSANDGENSFRTGTAPGVAVTADGTVHLVWGEWVAGTHAKVRYVRSTNGGLTWNAPISMNDEPNGHQFFPSIAADGNNVHVAWYDGRSNPAGTTITDLQVFYNRSADSGAFFQADEAITDRPFNPNLVSRFPVFCAAFIGDYLDIDAVDGRVAVIWDDNRNAVNPLSPTECADFRTRPTDPSIQPRLDGGALDQEAFVETFDIP
ncbi:MAG TPA: sialidase family protein, partial [Geminicoccaceae bacterium]|nr:sialidase family protein [Geminicoccaceae bacterium]